MQINNNSGKKFSQGKTKFETEGNYNTTLKSEINKDSNTQKTTWRYKKLSHHQILRKEM